nr:MAG TPA: Cytosine specific methyltransferase [Caudoviricetes sp.]
MNYGSICSGVEAATLAWRHLGWTPAFFSEVEPFPAAVLMQRLGATKPLRPLDPDAASDEKDRKQRLSWQSLIAEMPDGGTIPNLGDFTLIKKDDYDGKIDLLVGGTPCQDLSIAGKRLGFDGKRSVLALDFVRLCFETGTRWVLWENVPATLSSHNGEDFARFVSLLCGWDVPVPDDGWRKSGIVTGTPGHFGVCWRILDAQYTRVSQFPRAVPQRRKRLFLVGYLDHWKYPAQVLFDGEMCGGNSPPCRTKGQTAPSGAEGGIDTAKSIRMRAGKPGGGKGALIGDDLSHTLATGNDQTVVCTVHGAQTPISNDDHANALGCSNSGLENCVCISKQKKPEGRFWNGDDVAGTLTVTSDRQLMPDKGRLQCVIEPREDSVECLDTRQVDVHDTDLAPTLISTDYKGGKAICFQQNSRDEVRLISQDGTVAGALTASSGAKQQNYLCYENHAQDSRIKPVEVSQSIVARMGTGGGNLPLVKEPDVIGFIKNDAGGVQQGFWKNVFPTLRAAITPAITWNECFHLSFCDANGTRKDRKNGGLYVTKAETSQTVTAKGPHTETVIIALDGDKMAKAERKGGSGLGVSEDGVMYTQTVKDVHAVAYDECVPLDLRNATRDPEKHDARNRQGVGVGEDGAPMNTVTAASVPGVGWQATVRKLLPIECERLMGFPDNWTRISWKGKPEEECPDAPRYKACGNSMCVNVMAWLGERIDEVNRKIPSREGIFEMEVKDE